MIRILSPGIFAPLALFFCFLVAPSAGDVASFGRVDGEPAMGGSADDGASLVAVDGEPAMGVPADDDSEGREELDTSHLGPVVIRKDGTMGRIQGWERLGEQERARLLEAIKKRNAKRREEL